MEEKVYVSVEDVIEALDNHTFEVEQGLCLDTDIEEIMDEIVAKQNKE